MGSRPCQAQRGLPAREPSLHGPSVCLFRYHSHSSWFLMLNGFACRRACDIRGLLPLTKRRHPLRWCLLEKRDVRRTALKREAPEDKTIALATRWMPHRMMR